MNCFKLKVLSKGNEHLKNFKGQPIELSFTMLSKKPVFVDWLQLANANLLEQVFVIANIYSKPITFGGAQKFADTGSFEVIKLDK